MLNWTLEDIKNSNDTNGGTFFHKANVRHMKSRIYTPIFEGPGGVFFVTSEEGYDEVRRYQVRQFIPETGSIQAPHYPNDGGGLFRKYDNPREAQAAAEKLAQGVQ